MTPSTHRVPVRRDELTPDAVNSAAVDEAEARASFWRARAIDLGASPDEYRLFKALIAAAS